VTRLRDVLIDPLTGAICRLLLGGIFLYAACPKLLHPAEFALLVNGYRLLHPDLVNLAGITLPWVELIAGALLVLGVLPQSAALVAGGLLVAFIGGGFLALMRGLQIECGCFFPFMGGSKLNWVLFPRDLGMLLLAARVITWPSSWSARRRTYSGGDASVPADGVLPGQLSPRCPETHRRCSNGMRARSARGDGL